MEKDSIPVRFRWREILPQAILIILLILPIAKIQAQGKPSMTIWMKDGSSEIFLLEEKPNVQYWDGVVIVSTTNIEKSYLYNDVKKFTYSNITTSDIEKIIKDDGLGIIQDGDDVCIKGIAKNTIVSVYSIDGSLLYQTNSKEGNSVVIKFNDYPSGVYILKAGTKSLKYLKR